jgi:hypothetical protein
LAKREKKKAEKLRIHKENYEGSMKKFQEKKEEEDRRKRK